MKKFLILTFLSLVTAQSTPSRLSAILDPLNDVPYPRNLQDLALQLKTLVAHFNSESYESLVRQMRPRSDACIKFLKENSVKVYRSEVDNVILLVNATLQGFPKNGSVYQKASSIPELLNKHLSVLLDPYNGGNYHQTTQSYRSN